MMKGICLDAGKLTASLQLATMAAPRPVHRQPSLVAADPGRGVAMSVANILKLYDLSTAVEQFMGTNWYPSTREWLKAQAEEYDQPLATVVAAFAALSPRIGLKQNFDSLAALLAGFAAGKAWDQVVTSALNTNQRKAYEILRTADLSLLRGNKVVSFYHNILYPLSTDWVTVDVWAWRITVGDPSRKPTVELSPKRYEEVAELYRLAARRVLLRPSQIQAITWITARKHARAGWQQLPLDI